MDLTLEVYRIIVKDVGNRSDIAALCRVSKGFQNVAERALYNTIFMQDMDSGMRLCHTLATQPRVAVLVDAFTISLVNGSSRGDDNESDEEEYEEEESSDGVDLRKAERETYEKSLEVAMPIDFGSTATPTTSAGALAERYWSAISRALHSTTRLRYLNIHITNLAIPTASAWILRGCAFRLRSFHCDLDWDHDLVEFLNNQDDLEDLYIIDFNEQVEDVPEEVPAAVSQEITMTSPTQFPVHPKFLSGELPPCMVASESPPSASYRATLSPGALPRLNVLECTFSEAALSIVPNRPITRLKTCFSRTDPPAKRLELHLLFAKLRLSQKEFLALDIADSVYDEAFGMDMLGVIGGMRIVSCKLRYLGTLILPVGGNAVSVLILIYS